ncbi:MAG: right-handed parallel beta-helix repeat-containing protein [Planctomycetia bacterium]|nr:right-handed parallel beta-helix repeat-containing protein [Planctomycetia bacterium]
MCRGISSGRGMAAVFSAAWMSIIMACTSRGRACRCARSASRPFQGRLSRFGSSLCPRRSAKSYLNCRVRRREPEDFYGGHAATGSGRVGEWIEGCHFECLPDDGPAQQSFRVIPLGMDESDAVFIGGHLSSAPFKPGDRIAVVNPRTQRGTAATVRATSQVGRQVRIQFDRQLTDLAAEVGGAAPADWTGMHLFRDTPSNEDFVYRRNRHVGSRGHGLKFNGTRAWIADSHFENINGNAVLAGYVSEVSGHGARDVLVSGNTIIRCGWTPIEARSTSGLGGNIIIRDNRIDHVRDAAVSVQRCADVIIEGNRFSSPTPPVQGAWIVAVDAGDVTAEANEADPGVPEFKRVVTRKP